jgi:homoserine O-acetyltransferase
MTQLFKYDRPLTLESGAVLSGYHLSYTTLGKLNETGDNVVWVFHALTANSEPAQWWPGLVGEGRIFDPSDWFIVCVNMPGSCYGSTGPLDIDPRSKEPWYQDFPFFTPRDMIRAYQPLREFLGIEKIHTGIGGSMGGQQLLEWAIEEPELFEFIFPIATNARHSPWGIAFNTAQRMAIEADSSWKERKEDAGLAGMKAARATALLSYRHYDTYLKMQPRPEDYLAEAGWKGVQAPGTPMAPLDETQGQASREAAGGEVAGSGDDAGSDGAASYQRYQGEKLARRFSAFSYYTLSKSMDSHDTGRGRGGLAAALRQIRAKTLVIGIGSDILFPPVEQQLLAELIPGASYREIGSLYGHDGFLLEFGQIEKLVGHFIREGSSNNHYAREYYPGSR